MRALGDIGEKRASRALRERFVHDQHGQGAEAALDGLARLADPASQPVFFEQVASRDADLRRAAFEGLARLGDVAAIRAVEARTGGEKRSHGPGSPAPSRSPATAAAGCPS